MKDAIKLVLAGALFAAGAATANTLTDTGTNNGTQQGGDLVLLVSDVSKGTFYAFDTGTSLDAVKTESQIQTDLGGASNPGATAIFQTPNLGNGTLTFNTVINVGTNLTNYLATDATKSVNSNFNRHIFNFLQFRKLVVTRKDNLSACNKASMKNSAQTETRITRINTNFSHRRKRKQQRE